MDVFERSFRYVQWQIQMPQEARVVVVHPNANSVELLALLTMHHVKVIRQALQLQG